MAHFTTFHLYPLPKCRECGRAASKVLRNSHNAEMGHYCGQHAKPALRKAETDEQRRRLREFIIF